MSGGCLEDFLKGPGRCLGVTLKMLGRCQEGVWNIEGVWRVYGKCWEGACKEPG